MDSDRKKDFKTTALLQTVLPKGVDEKSQFVTPKQLTSLLEAAQIPGISFAEIKRAEDTRSMALGIANKKLNNNVTDETIFPAASLSKPLFAYLVVILMEKHLLPSNFLDTPLIHKWKLHITFFGDKTINLAEMKYARQLTPRLILSHQSGFIDNWIDPNAISESTTYLITPGTQFNYSGEAYNYLQHAIESITKTNLEKLAKKFIFEPLNMLNSSFLHPDPSKLVAAGHNKEMTPEPSFDKPIENSAASLYTTALDYSKFLLAMLNLNPQTPLLNPVLDMTKDPAAFKKKISPEFLRQVFWGMEWGLQKHSMV